MHCPRLPVIGWRQVNPRTRLGHVQHTDFMKQKWCSYERSNYSIVVALETDRDPIRVPSYK